MNKLGAKFLRTAGIVEIIIGIFSIFFTRMLLSEVDSITILSTEVTKDALLGLVYIYGVNLFNILLLFI